MSLSWCSIWLRTGEIVAELPDLDVSEVSQTMGEYTTVTASLPVPTAPVGWEKAIVEGGNALILCDDETPIWGGLITRAPRTEGDVIDMTLVTIEGYLDRRYVGDCRYTQVGQNLIVADLIRRWVADGPVPGIPLRVQIVGGPGVLRDRSYADADDRKALAALQELSAVEGGPEWTTGWERVGDRITPVLYVGDRLGVTEAAVVFSLPGSVHTAEWLTDYSDGRGANRVIATSSGQGSTRPQSPPQVGSEDDGRPTFEYRWSPSSSIANVQTLVDHAQGAVARLSGGTTSLTMSAVVEDSPRVGVQWGIGDMVGYDLASPALGHREGVARAIGWSMTLRDVPMITPVLDVTSATAIPRFNARLSLYNAASRQLTRWRAARSAAATGTGSAHISAFVDSITFGFGLTPPVGVTSWPARLRSLLETRLGYTGTGMVPLLDGGSGQAAAEPRVRIYGGNIAHGGGIYGLGSWGINDAVGAGVEVGPIDCDTIILWHGAEAGLGQVWTDAGMIGTFANGVGPDSDGATWPTRVVRGSLLCTTITLPTRGMQTVRVAPPVGGHLHPLAIEARYGTTGVRVSNLAQNSMTTVQMVADDPTGALSGMSITLDAAAADLSVMVLGMNEFQGHYDVAAFKDRVRVAVLRQRQSGDVLLVTPPRPDPATTPVDGIHVPPLSDYAKVLYDLADELDVPLLDMGDRWRSWANSNGLGWNSDRVHLSDAGASAFAQDVLNALDTL